MITCIFVKRKLYEYIDNALSEEEKIKVQGHLTHCPSCAQEAARLGRLFEIASRNTTPQPSPEFWHNFRVELDDRLNKKLVSPFSWRPAPHWRLKPALVMPLVSVFAVVITFSLYFHSRPMMLPSSDEQLVNEMILLNEISPESRMIIPEEMYTDDLTSVN